MKVVEGVDEGGIADLVDVGALGVGLLDDDDGRLKAFADGCLGVEEGLGGLGVLLDLLLRQLQLRPRSEATS